MKQVRIVGAGWAGLAAAVFAVQDGWQVHLYETAHHPGGRARSLDHVFAGQPLDNGQHVLIGAYRDTLALMHAVDLEPETLLKRQPLNLQFADQQGISLPDWPAPWNVLTGIVSAKGWCWRDKHQLLLACWQWQRAGFTCPSDWTVAQLCAHHALTAEVTTRLIEPLCLSALNTPLKQASALVFLRVLHDALLGGCGSADLLIPTCDLGALFPKACVRWLKARGAQIHFGHRIMVEDLEGPDFQPQLGQALVLACPAWEAARLTAARHPEWSQQAARLTHTAITTVYLHCTDTSFAGLSQPMVALHSDVQQPAQFVFDRGALTQQPGLLACVVSASQGERDEIAERVRQQVMQQLGLQQIRIVQTVVEKRATLACLPELVRPDTCIAPYLFACGDYVRGPYPSTLEGAVRSGQEVIAQLRHR